MAKSHKSLQGQLLLDGGKLQGSAFHRSVVLVCQHDPRGAFGLVLNQPTEKRLSDALDAELPEVLGESLLYSGGPVQPSAMSFLHAHPDLQPGNVLKSLSLGHDLEELVAIGKGWSPQHQMRVFAGYAGWAPGQLDDEIRRDSWLLHPATVELVFRLPPEELWRYLLRCRGDWQSRLLADSPEDLSWN
jgi:putative transcriptional regulator